MIMREWLDPPDFEPTDELAQELGLSRWIAGVLARRGIKELKSARGFLDPNAYTPARPSELPGVDSAADRLQHAIGQGEHILVWGDFDVDGQTATALFVEGLRELGGVVSYHIPIRAQESHGVSLPVLRQYLDGANPPNVVLTCDTGIAAFDAAEYARRKHVDLLITDHHELPRQPDGDAWRLPSAEWIVTPRFLASNHPLATLPGVGVAYKLIEALFTQTGRAEMAGKFLDLVALGIVADVAYQIGDARYLLQRGLEILQSQPRPGLQAIYERADLNPRGLSEEHIGFVLAPRLNALGRLGDANPAVELLTTSDRSVARLITLQLEALNARRQLLTSQVLRGALAQLQQNRALLDEPALVLANPAWEAGVIGIVASRLVELYGKPVVMITSPPGGPGRGSARSVEGVDITRAIASQADLLLGFGGHAMAAGFSIPEENIADFHRGINRAVAAAALTIPLEPPPLQIDAYLPWENISLDTVTEIERLAPFGPGNPPLTLASRDLRLVSQAVLGREQEHLMLTVEDASGLSRRVIWWGGANLLEAGGMPQGTFDLAYRVRSRTYRGVDDLQLEFVGFRPVPGMIEVTEYHPVVEDYRLEANPLDILLHLLAQLLDGETFVWAEGMQHRRSPVASSKMAPSL
jgi:single-stranded-DNA-specific exonuclease